MELSPLGGGLPPTPGTAETQTQPVQETPNRPPNTGWENPYAQPAPPVEPVTTQRSNGSTITTRAIVSVVVFLVLGGLRVYSRYQRMQERYEPTSEQALNQDNAPRSFRDDTAPATPEPPALRQSSTYSPQGHTAPSSAPYLNPGLRQPQGAQYPSLPPQAQVLLRRELNTVSNGRNIALVTIRPLGNGMYEAAITYTSGSDSHLTFNGTAWTSAGENAALSQSPPPNRGETNVSSAPPSGSPNPYANTAMQQTTAAPGTSTAPGNVNPVINPPSASGSNSAPPGDTPNTTPAPPPGG